jgi:hypothetical protein
MDKASLPKNVIVLRWIARIIGTLLALFIISQFVGSLIRNGYINVDHPGHYVLFVFFGLAQIGILISWRWERVGGCLIAFGIIVFDLLNIFWVQSNKMTDTLIASIFWLILSFIFLYCWWKTKENLSHTE